MELKKYPLKLSPVCKEIIWGGTKLKSDFGKVCDLEKVAESWELTVRYDGMNTIENGPHTGMTLADYKGHWHKQSASSSQRQIFQHCGARHPGAFRSDP